MELIGINFCGVYKIHIFYIEPSSFSLRLHDVGRLSYTMKTAKGLSMYYVILYCKTTNLYTFAEGILISVRSLQRAEGIMISVRSLQRIFSQKFATQ